MLIRELTLCDETFNVHIDAQVPPRAICMSNYGYELLQLHFDRLKSIVDRTNKLIKLNSIYYKALQDVIAYNGETKIIAEIYLKEGQKILDTISMGHE